MVRAEQVDVPFVVFAVPKSLLVVGAAVGRVDGPLCLFLHFDSKKKQILLANFKNFKTNNKPDFSLAAPAVQLVWSSFPFELFLRCCSIE